jgi:hypothetical protein
MLRRDPAENESEAKKLEKNVRRISLPNIWCISIRKGRDAPYVTVVTYLLAVVRLGNGHCIPQ